MIVLDTYAWLAWTSAPTRLTARAARAIAEEEPRRGIVVSAISVWEMAAKVAQGKVVLDRDIRQWTSFATSYPGLSVVPVDPVDALESTLLPGDLPKDPADRLIVALARRLDVPIVTADRTLRSYRHVKTIW